MATVISAEQEPPAVTKGFSFRHVIRCQMVEARSSTTENVLKVGSIHVKGDVHQASDSNYTCKIMLLSTSFTFLFLPKFLQKFVLGGWLNRICWADFGPE